MSVEIMAPVKLQWNQFTAVRNVMTDLLVCTILILVSCQGIETKKSGTEYSPMADSIGHPISRFETGYTPDEMYRDYIPGELLKYIKETHPTWSVPAESKWYPQLFNKYKSTTSLVNFISGDFDCSGSNDYALIVEKGGSALAAVAFLRDGRGFKTVELTDIPRFNEGKIEFMLTGYKPGKYHIVDPDLAPSDPANVVFDCSSVGIGTFSELFEGGDQVYYWNKGSLQSCVIER